MIGVGTFKTTEKARAYVNDVLDTNRLSYGPYLKNFEKKFAEIHDSKFAVTSNSGTSALHIALAALKEKHGWGDGDEVIVPAVTFIATSNIVLHNNMQPVFVDVESTHYELDPKKIEDKITDRTRAIIPVHLFGQPCDMDPIMEIAEKHGLKVIEDSCETMFAKYKGKSVGTFGDFGCFSTYVAHLLTTGVGGITVTSDPELAVMVRSMANHGRDSIYMNIDDDDGKKGDELKEIISKRFSFVRLGHSFRLTELEGALGLAQIEELEPMIVKRKENAAYLTEKLQSVSDKIQLPSVRAETDHSFMMYPLVLKDEPKENLVNYLENNEVETRDTFPLITQPIYHKLFNLKEDEYPVAKWIANSGFYVGCHQELTKEDLDHIIKTITAYFSQK